MTVFTLTEFFNKLAIEEYTLDLTNNVQTSRTVSGMTYRAGRGVRLWHGTITLANAVHADARERDALINRIQQPGNYFNFTPMGERGVSARPRLWKTGDNLASVITSGTQTVGYSLRLGGLPAAYVLSAGDMLSFSLNGIFRLYRIVANATANASGVATVTLNIPLTNGNLPPANTAVQLISPQLTCAYKDGSFSGSTYNSVYSDSVSFEFHQVFRT